jgi:hypothetical protein
MALRCVDRRRENTALPRSTPGSGLAPAGFGPPASTLVIDSARCEREPLEGLVRVRYLFPWRRLRLPIAGTASATIGIACMTTGLLGRIVHISSMSQSLEWEAAIGMAAGPCSRVPWWGVAKW